MELFKSIYFRLFVFAVVMPINGILIERGHVFLGLILIIAQIPLFLIGGEK